MTDQATSARVTEARYVDAMGGATRVSTQGGSDPERWAIEDLWCGRKPA